jgi:hypothetical protein
MNDIHAPHSSTGIVPEPFIPILEIRLNSGIRVFLLDSIEKIAE